ncbi:glycosyltransferase family 9 protein [Gloeobacter kilaueensis]|uniref:Glycosyl transferase family 9 n=1 Tax=Gloeobacter kilaueensis (strain ATCC BAA-2537 / CCAP 1431/1 / ULC 316 / JS1) TaxID=1183438 RepID=U5QHP0_GLOK1|nr:glycosyltransferase family 9 protein [Gloeobacter kilaueensis]AGY57185.1 glycosyl transferase family 9 [Gloeobacter kilaueensis JS1]
MQPDWSNVRRILAMRLDNIGDVVMLGPALRALRDALPEMHLTLMVSPAGAQIAPLLPWIDECLVERVLWQDASARLPFAPEREHSRIAALAGGHFDAAFFFTSFSQSPHPPAFACYLAGIPVRIGQSKEFGGGMLSHAVLPPADSLHQVDRNLHLLAGVGIKSAAHPLELHVPEPVQAQADALLTATVGRSDEFIALAPGASCAARRYSATRFAQVVPLLEAHTRMPVVVLGSAAEQALCEQVSSLGGVSLAGRTNLAQMAAILRRAQLVIANNSGPLHIADAFARPMVILYSGSELESQWRPRSSPACLLRVPTACSPCYRFDCHEQLECLEIDPQAVVGAALELLSSGTLVTAGGKRC